MRQSLRGALTTSGRSEGEYSHVNSRDEQEEGVLVDGHRISVGTGSNEVDYRS
jgi:hypothetical protein